MPPRRSARLVELANPHFQLPFPPNVVARLFSLLPLDARLRAREVCRGWRFFLEDVSFWTRVHLSKSCGVNPRFRYDSPLALALLRAACVRAKGGLQSVDLSGVFVGWMGVPFVPQWAETLSAAHKASLRDLVAPPSDRLEVEQVTALCRTLPLCRVRCSVECDTVEALPLLRREPPFALLTINKLVVLDNVGDEAVLDLASALTGHKGMEKLSLYDVPLATRAVVDAVVDAAISAGIKDMRFHNCGLSQTALPALTRLLQSPGFERLELWNSSRAVFEGRALSAFCEALRNCKSLRKLQVVDVILWADTAAASQLIAALEGLPTLQKLELQNDRTNYTPDTQRVIGECLARLIARSTSLRKLNFPDRLGEACLAPIFQAVRGTTGLACLGFSNARISVDFARDMVLPAVRANTSLRILEGLRWVDAEDSENDDEEEEQLPELQEVQDIFAARRRADEEAA